MRSIPLPSVAATDLGIEVAPHEDGAQFGWFWRLRAPAPYFDWSGPLDTHEAAQARALCRLLYLAGKGDEALDGVDVAVRFTEQPTNAANDDELVYGVPL